MNAKTILDAGCGNGELCGLLAKSGFDVMGVDADRKGIEIASKRFPSTRFEISLFTDMPPRTGFDLVVSTEVVEHLYSPHELIHFAFKALKPGGVFAITTPYHGYLKNLMLSLTDHWDKHHTANWHGGHIKFWSRKTLTTLLENGGFTIIDFVGVGRIPYLWKSMILISQKPTV